MTTDDDQESRFNPNRRLCPDGNCIGVIGGDGKCTVCGTADAGGPAAEPEDEGEPQSDVAMPAAVDEILPGQDAEASSGFDPNRRLCSDGDCIGVIGGDNRCSVCGKPAES